MAGYWNHRVIKTKDESGGFVFAIHETHYDEDHHVKYWTVSPTAPIAFVEDPSSAQAEDPVESLRWTLQRMLEALDKPVLDERQLL